MASIPEFKSNLGIDVQGRGIVSGSGQRAQSRATNSFANLLDQISQDTTQRIAEEQKRRAASGEFEREELPSAMTTIGKATRQGYAESQALSLNMEIRNKVSQITSDPSKNTSQMTQEIEGVAQAMASENIPELTGYINQTFSRYGISEINSVAKQRLKNQRESIKRTFEEQEKFYSEAFVKDFGLSRLAEFKAKSIENALANNEITEAEAADMVASMDEGAIQRLGDSEASLKASLQSQVKAGLMTTQEAEFKFEKIKKEARLEGLTQLALERGDVEFLDNEGLSVEEQVDVLNRFSNIARIENEFEDRREKEERDSRDEMVNTNIAQIQADMYTGKATPEDIEERINRLINLNSMIGSKELGDNIEKLRGRWEEYSAAGGPPNPANFAKFKRKILLGDIVSIQQLEDLGFGVLNQDEQSDLVQLVNSEMDERLSSASFRAVKERIKTSLPDHPGAPSFEEMISGAKVPEEQRRIEEARDNIYDQLLEGVQNGDLVNPQQMQSFVNQATMDAFKAVYQDEIKEIQSFGFTGATTDEEMVQALVDIYPDSAEAKKKFISIKRILKKVGNIDG